MPPCQFTLASSRDPVSKGQEFVISMNPALKPGCAFTVAIDGVQVSPGDDVGNLHVIGFGAEGTATFRALKDCPQNLIIITVMCGNCGPTPRGYRLCQEKVRDQGGIPLSPPAEDYYRLIQEERRRREDREERRREDQEERRERRRRPKRKRGK